MTLRECFAQFTDVIRLENLVVWWSWANVVSLSSVGKGLRFICGQQQPRTGAGEGESPSDRRPSCARHVPRPALPYFCNTAHSYISGCVLHLYYSSGPPCPAVLLQYCTPLHLWLCAASRTIVAARPALPYFCNTAHPCISGCRPALPCRTSAILHTPTSLAVCCISYYSSGRPACYFCCIISGCRPALPCRTSAILHTPTSLAVCCISYYSSGPPCPAVLLQYCTLLHLWLCAASRTIVAARPALPYFCNTAHSYISGCRPALPCRTSAILHTPTSLAVCCISYYSSGPPCPDVLLQYCTLLHLWLSGPPCPAVLLQYCTLLHLWLCAASRTIVRPALPCRTLILHLISRPALPCRILQLLHLWLCAASRTIVAARPALRTSAILHLHLWLCISYYSSGRPALPYYCTLLHLWLCAASRTIVAARPALPYFCNTAHSYISGCRPALPCRTSAILHTPTSLAVCCISYYSSGPPCLCRTSAILHTPTSLAVCCISYYSSGPPCPAVLLQYCTLLHLWLCAASRTIVAARPALPYFCNTAHSYISGCVICLMEYCRDEEESHSPMSGTASQTL
ncbi:hypothetical protein J6590_078087 [Homalodisca vitripennis]|nr:hypothetical protein J6590_078087 [Homalodisca vitripennis]